MKKLANHEELVCLVGQYEKSVECKLSGQCGHAMEELQTSRMSTKLLVDHMSRVKNIDFVKTKVPFVNKRHNRKRTLQAREALPHAVIYIPDNSCLLCYLLAAINI